VNKGAYETTYRKDPMYFSASRIFVDRLLARGTIDLREWSTAAS